MDILVTGSAGFIGFHLAKKLLSEGHTVAGIDNIGDYYCPELKRLRHDILRSYADFTAYEKDLCDLAALEQIFKKHGPKLICNLAAQVGVRYSLVNPFAYNRSNVEGFLNIIDIARRSKVERFVYASSSSVYGGNTDVPFSETQRVDTPISLYAATKKADELIAHSYSHTFALQTVGLRLFTVYGPWGRPDMAIWSFTESIEHGEPIKVFNHGRMMRDFTYIDDVVAGLHAALLKKNLPPYSIFNIGNNRSEQLLSMIGILERCLGKKAVMQLEPMQPGDMVDTFAAIEQAQQSLDFKPSTPLEAGIPKFIEWYRANPAIASLVRKQRQTPSAVR